MTIPRSGDHPPRDHPSRRVRVVSPRTAAARAAPTRPVGREIDEQTLVGEVYMRSLVRVQLRLAIGVCLVLAALLGGLPLVTALVPQLSDVRLMGVPLPWLLLGVAVYPLLLLGGWLYVRQAERNERDFVELVQ